MKNQLALVVSLSALMSCASALSSVNTYRQNASKESCSMSENQTINGDQWKKVDSLAAEGLPQSALLLVNVIAADAEKKGDIPVFLKAALYQLKLRSSFEENYIQNYIGETEKNLTLRPEPARQILHSILADLYWQYYQQNRYRILDQTMVKTELSSDIATWDARRFVETVSQHYQASLNNATLLQSVSLKQYDPVLLTAEGSKKFRPTLFDFLGHRAFDFYIAEEASLTKPVQAFGMNDPQMLGLPGDFTALSLSTKDTLSFHFQAIRIAQQLEKFHLYGADPVPLMDVTIKRLEFVRNNSSIANSDSLTLSTLSTLEKRYEGSEAAADLIAQIARIFYTDQGLQNSSTTAAPAENYIIARDWCLKAIRLYPASEGAENCRVILQSIEEPMLGLRMDKEVVPGKPFPVLLEFRNTKAVWFRLLAIDYDKEENLRQEVYSERGLDKYLGYKPLKEWSIPLPEINDFKQHSVELIMPAIETGYYALLVSGDPSFSRDKSPLVVRDFWSSSISYISQRKDDGSGEFFILSRNSGSPLQGVKVQSFTREYDYKSRSYVRKSGDVYISGPDGSFTVAEAQGRDYTTLSFDFSKGSDRLVAENYFSRYQRNEPQKTETIQSFLFTDRAIYRPGQTVWFKGIVVANSSDNSRIVPGQQSSVALFDANGQKISSTTVVTSKYGSFSGSFVLPASGLGGQFRLENSSGSCYFSVEEYKQPKFKVEFQPITDSYRLNQTVRITGKAESFSGVPISEAMVNYRVVRSVYFPFYRYGSRSWPGHRPESEIANALLTTAPDGTFTIHFTALAGTENDGSENPVYIFTVYADVTDINGETRSSVTSVQVSSKALVIGAEIPAEINREKAKPFGLISTNLNGRKTPAVITVEVFPLIADNRLTRPRNWETPDTTAYSRAEFILQLPSDIYFNENERNLIKGSSLYKKSINTATDSLFSLPELPAWEPGRYLISLSAKDPFGETVSTDKEFILFSSSSRKVPVVQALWCNLINPEAGAGETVQLLAGSSAKNARILFSVQDRGKILRQEWVTLSREVKKLSYSIPEDYSGEITFSVLSISDNRSHNFTGSVTVPEKKHQLKIAFETFRSPLLPGNTEKWKLKITDADNNPLSAELLAAMYDASLDAFVPHSWDFRIAQKWFQPLFWESSRAFETTTGISFRLNRPDLAAGVSRTYDRLNWFGYNLSGFGSGEVMYIDGIRVRGAKSIPESAMAMDENVEITRNTEATPMADSEGSAAELPVMAEPKLQVRRNLKETAFFFPHLSSNAEGEVWVEFTVPEALTQWNFMGLAHTSDLRYGQIARQAVTRKELMVTPNLPRFFREGDKITIQAKISNQAANPVQGKARLQLFDAISLQGIDQAFENNNHTKPFDLESAGNTVAEWTLRVPEGIDAVMVRITAEAGNHSDGEEVMLPVLTNRMLVTETLPLPVNGAETKEFTFSRLLDQAGSSSTLRNHRLNLEFTSNPAWYAVQALPYLAESENENTDAVFNRIYANSLAAYIANSSPKIRSVFEIWKMLTPDALLSNLEKNQELKSLLLEETPWLMEGKSESEQKQRIGLMFDLQRMAGELQSGTLRLQQQQSANGGWPWFEGMPESRYITQLIMTGFGRLHHLSVIDLKNNEAFQQMVQHAATYLQMRIKEDYQQIMKDHPEDYDRLEPGQEQLQFLFAMSYLKDVVSMEETAADAVAYFGSQARRFWANQGLYSQGMIALWAGRNGDQKTAVKIMKSLRERALVHPELGMYWRDNQGGYSWYQAPVETQALLIELFEELGNDTKAVDQMKTWLLKQKQTQKWATSRATADAVYAMLLRGSDWLQTEPGVAVTLGGKPVDFSSRDNRPEAGTGYLKSVWTGNEINPQMGQIVVSKTSAGPAWGALTWQYFENLDKISLYGNSLKISSKLFARNNTDEGPVLQEITEGHPLTVGQKVVVRIELKSDRDLEFVHLKGMRAAGFEPANTLSGYRWSNGLGYYESTRDASSEFFIGYLPKGTWVFEYPLVAAQKGEFSGGVNSIQCMYAPEFAAHSEGIRLVVH